MTAICWEIKCEFCPTMDVVHAARGSLAVQPCCCKSEYSIVAVVVMTVQNSSKYTTSFLKALRPLTP